VAVVVEHLILLELLGMVVLVLLLSNTQTLAQLQ
jgi:hypothetical protein